MYNRFWSLLLAAAWAWVAYNDRTNPLGLAVAAFLAGALFQKAVGAVVLGWSRGEGWYFRW